MLLVEEKDKKYPGKRSRTVLSIPEDLTIDKKVVQFSII